jgi:predicted phage tail protein
MLDRTDIARLGHNNPPSPIEIATGTNADLSRWMADHPVVQGEDHARAGKALLDRAKASLDEMEAERDRIVRPLNEQVKAINDRYRPARTSLEKLADELKKRLSAYARALEIERVRKAEEARKAAEEAEKAAREAEQREREAVECADHGVCDVDLGAATQDADAAFAAFRKADHVAARAERDSRIRITGGFDRAMGLRDRETLTVTDWHAAITELGLTDLIRDAILTSARAYRKNFRELPEGVVATYDRSL